MSKLSNYVRRNALFAMLAGVLGLWGLQLVFAYLGEIESIGAEYRVWDAFRFIGYRSPYFLSQFMPTGVLLGAVVGLGLLANNSELVVMRAAGISIYRIVGWVLQPAFLFVLLALAINEWVLPISQQHAHAIKSPSTILTINGYWSVRPNDTGQEIVYIGQADSNGNLSDIKRFVLHKGALSSIAYAKSGGYIEDKTNHYQWQLNQVKSLSLLPQTATQNPSTTTTTTQYERLTLPIAKDSVKLLTRDPDDMSISELYAHKNLMHHQGTNSPKHKLAFWQKLLSPLAVLSLVLVACSFVFGSLRSQSLGLRIVMALFVGLLFSYLQDLVGFVALAGNLSPLPLVALPIVAVGLLGVLMIAKKR